MSRMKAVQVFVLIITILYTECGYIAPTWTVNALLNSGQAKPCNAYTGGGTAPSTFNVTQTFNASFASAPRVVLSLLGYKQNAPCLGCNVGFKIVIISTTSSAYISTVSVYGANIMILHYFYMGVSNSALEFSVDYQSLQFVSGNLVDTSSPSRSITNINSNVAGESYPNYASHKIANKIYLAGYKMTVGNTGIYINMTTDVVNSSHHSVTISTIADVQIYQVCYFRISIDLTTYMAGYTYIVDEVSFYGFNNIQQMYSSTITASSLQYRNQLMGFNKIYIAGTAPSVDIKIAAYLTWQTLWTTASEAPSPVFTNATFVHLNADLFHNRKRICPGTQPYFDFPSLRCYDICPDGTYPMSSPAMYCEVCHYSCLTCNGGSTTNCILCPSNSSRSFDSNSTSCPCNSNYFDNGITVCAICAYPCLTCVTSNNTCTSCDSSLHRTLNTSNSSCLCDSAYYEQLVNGTYVCSPCIATCLTCLTSSSYCLSCDTSQNRTLNTTNNICQCNTGFYQTSLNTPAICLSCHPTCITCTSSSTYCLSCDNINHHRTLNTSSNICQCNTGYYQTSTNTPTICLSCSTVCLTCTSLSTYCLSCDTNNTYRVLNVSTNNCECIDGYYQISAGNPLVCASCIATCITCATSSDYCTSCDAPNHHRTLNTTNNICECNTGYYQTSLNTPTICLSCTATCITCSVSSTYCLSCDTVNHHRILNISSNTCQCSTGFYQTSLNTPTICLPCNPTCLTCTSSSTYCTSCDTNNTYRILNTTNNKCECISSHYQDTICKPCTIYGCTSCILSSITMLQQCITCNITNNYILINNTCICNNNQYYNTTNNICTICHYTCNTCTNEITCATCNGLYHRVLNNNNTISNYCICQDGYIADNNITNPICLACDKKCLTCQIVTYNCLTCDNTTRALSTNTTNSSFSTCICHTGTMQSPNIYALCISPFSVCGDGIIASSEQCDDHNSNSNDGCSADCQVEMYHSCQTTTYNNGTSLCYYDRQLNIAIQTVLKLLTDNKVSIVLKIQAILCNLDTLKNYLQSLKAIILSTTNRLLLASNNNIHKLNAAGNSQVIYISSASFQISDASKYQGYLTLILDYTENIATLSNKQLTFAGSNQSNSPSKYFFATPLSNIILIDPQNNIPMQYYQQSSYKLTIILSYIFLVINIIDLILFIILIEYKRTIIGIQNILILQFIYFSIISLSHIQLNIASIAYYGKYITGININILQTNTNINTNTKNNNNNIYIGCKDMTKLYQQCNSIDNINITYYIALLAIIISIAILAYKKYRDHQISVVAVNDRDSGEDNIQENNIQNNIQNNVEDSSRNNNNNAFQLTKNASNLQIVYELPHKIKRLLSVCLEYSFGIFFITAIEWSLTTLHLTSTYKTVSIAWLVTIFMFFIVMWIIYYLFYPLTYVSYVKIHRTTLQKLSIFKFAYFGLFVYLLVWGAVVGTAPGIVAYVMNILLALIWLFLTIKSKIYRARAHQIRAIINQCIIICTAFIFIMLEYVVKDGLAVAPTIVLLILLVAGLISNVGFCAYQIYVQRLCSKVLNEAEQLKQLERSRQQQYSSRKKMEGSQMVELRDLTTPGKREPLVSESKRTIRSKMDQLRTFKKKTNSANPLIVHNNMDYNFDSDNSSNKVKDQDAAKMQDYANL